MSSKPFLGVTRRVGPNASPKAGSRSLEGLIDVPRTQSEIELRDILRKIDIRGTDAQRIKRELFRSARQSQRSEFARLAERVRAVEARNRKTLRALAKIARVAARRHPAGLALNLIEILRRGMPPAGVPYGDGTVTGRPGVSVCGFNLPWANCTDRQVSSICAAAQFTPSDGSCVGSAVVPAGSGYSEFRNYHVGSVIAYRRATVVRFAGAAGASAIASSDVLPEIGPNGRGARMRQPVPNPQNEEQENGGIGLEKTAPRWPALQPSLQPVAGPSGVPLPIPLRLLHLRKQLQPLIDPMGLSESSYSEEPRWKDDFEFPTTAGETIQIKPKGEPRRIPPEHKFEPPGPRRKEVKVGGFRVLLGLVNKATESKDFIDAIYEGVGEDCKRIHERRIKRRTNYSFMRPQDKLEVLYHCAATLDVCKAVKALIENQVEDYVLGRTGQKLGELARQFSARKVPIGFQTGGSLGKLGRGNRGQDTGKKPWDKWTDALVDCRDVRI